MPCCTVVSAAYFPPVEYFMAAACTGRLLIEGCGSYVKQTYRNRCRIYACDGVLSLTVPVSMPHGSKSEAEALIDYSKPWLQQHWRALVSAYRTSAFFEYYQDDIQEILASRPAHLLELDLRLTVLMLRLLGLRCEVGVTTDFVPVYDAGYLDLRESFHPKKAVPEEFRNRLRPYYQVFSERYGFIPGLSALDLLFNEGPDAVSYLL